MEKFSLSLNHEKLSSNKTIFWNGAPRASMNSTTWDTKSTSPHPLPSQDRLLSNVLSYHENNQSSLGNEPQDSRVKGACPHPSLAPHTQNTSSPMDSSWAAFLLSWCHPHTGPHFWDSATVLLMIDLLTPGLAASTFCRLGFWAHYACDRTEPHDWEPAVEISNLHLEALHELTPLSRDSHPTPSVWLTPTQASDPPQNTLCSGKSSWIPLDDDSSPATGPHSPELGQRHVRTASVVAPPGHSPRHQYCWLCDYSWLKTDAGTPDMQRPSLFLLTS